MAEITTFLPTYDSSEEYNAELLRQSIPLMVKNKVSIHPINYAIWYEYVANNNDGLKKDIDDLINTQSSFNEKTSLDLYRNHICNASVEQFEKINLDIQNLVDKAASNVEDASQEFSTAGDNLLANSVQLEKASDLSEVKSVLSGVAAETRQLLEISQTLKTKLNEAHEEMATLRDELSKTKEMATTDALTGLLNRRGFDSEIASLVDNAMDNEHCLLILDLDHFKQVNDTFGHLVGDKVIRYTARLLKKHTDEHHISARYGGEEMAVIMPNTKLKTALEIAETIRESLASSQLKQKNDDISIGKITVSIGVTTLTNDDCVESFIERADNALYNAKDTGRNKVVHQ